MELEAPDLWEIGPHTAQHIPSGVIIWVSSGPFFFDGYGKYSGILNLVERHFLWRKFRNMQRTALANAISKSRP